MKVRLNPDTEIVNDIRKKLKDNNGYCPCNPIKSLDTKCKCKDFRDMVRRGEVGMCHCGLFISEKE